LSAHAKTGLVTFCGPNLEHVTSKQTFDALKRAVTASENLPVIEGAYAPAGSDGDASSSGKRPKPADKWELKYTYSPVQGTAEGALIGGNLTALSSLMGTSYQPPFKNSILFLEDIDESNDMLDRWFTNLYVAGSLNEVSGVAFGDFVNCAARDCVNLYSLEDLFGDRLKELSKPCCFAMPLGQSSRAVTVPIGVRVKLDTFRSTIEFLEPATTA
ncbi:MAG TPA: hypothetical protein V6D17_06015, partial [Candidatus Obscuribacterales bacterium]